ncbi:hypothetical protein AYJ54_13955 [Bradyrhizobium centrolobii]|uniref:Uncharacterized protein n=1 Tax=Bradyrhizobium centrolobii TaxID=1505087 RepID=A0A176YQL0_9BRAD|nr:hypothetical protein AYJ54_13955 [Bradyrhizobium centrolobii]
MAPVLGGSCESQEVLQQQMPLLAQYGFRMKLDAIGRFVTMCDGHDLAFLRTRRHNEVTRARLIELDDERMVAPNTKGGGEILK